MCVIIVSLSFRNLCFLMHFFFASCIRSPLNSSLIFIIWMKWSVQPVAYRKTFFCPLCFYTDQRVKVRGVPTRSVFMYGAESAPSRWHHSMWHGIVDVITYRCRAFTWLVSAQWLRWWRCKGTKHGTMICIHLLQKRKRNRNAHHSHTTLVYLCMQSHINNSRSSSASSVGDSFVFLMAFSQL